MTLETTQETNQPDGAYTPVEISGRTFLVPPKFALPENVEVLNQAFDYHQEEVAKGLPVFRYHHLAMSMFSLMRSRSNLRAEVNPQKTVNKLFLELSYNLGKERPKSFYEPDSTYVTDLTGIRLEDIAPVERLLIRNLTPGIASILARKTRDRFTNSSYFNNYSAQTKQLAQILRDYRRKGQDREIILDIFPDPTCEGCYFFQRQDSKSHCLSLHNEFKDYDAGMRSHIPRKHESIDAGLIFGLDRKEMQEKIPILVKVPISELSSWETFR